MKLWREATWKMVACFYEMIIFHVYFMQPSAFYILYSVGWPESRLMYNSSCWLFPAQFGEVRCSSKQRLGCFVIRIICTRNGPNSLSSTSHPSWSINSIAFIGNCFQSPCHYHNLSEFLHEIINGKTVIFLVQDRCESILIIHTIICLVQVRCDSSLTIQA